MATHNRVLTDFYNDQFPADFMELVARIRDDPGMTAQPVHPWVTPSGYRAANRAVNFHFDQALTGPEIIIVNSKVAEQPGISKAAVTDWLQDMSGEGFHGCFENITSETRTSNGPTPRIEQTVTLAGGRYFVDWSAVAYGTAMDTTYRARAEIHPSGESNNIFSSSEEEGPEKFMYEGFTEMDLPAGLVTFRVSMWLTGGGGSVAMKRAGIKYRWVGPAA